MQTLSFFQHPQKNKKLWNIVIPLCTLFFLPTPALAKFPKSANFSLPLLLNARQMRILQKRATPAADDTVTLDCCNAVEARLPQCKDATMLECSHAKVDPLQLPECISGGLTVNCCDKRIAAAVGPDCVTTVKGDCSDSEIAKTQKCKGNMKRINCTVTPTDPKCDCLNKSNVRVECCQLNPSHSGCCSSKSGEDRVICCKPDSSEPECLIPISTCEGNDDGTDCPDCTNSSTTVDLAICCILNPFHSACKSIYPGPLTIVKPEKEGFLALGSPCLIKDDNCKKAYFLECKPDDYEQLDKGHCGCLEGLWTNNKTQPCRIPLDDPCGDFALHSFKGVSNEYKKFPIKCQDYADCVKINDNLFCRASEDRDYPMFVSRKRALQLEKMAKARRSLASTTPVSVTKLTFYMIVLWMVKSFI